MIMRLDATQQFKDNPKVCNVTSVVFVIAYQISVVSKNVRQSLCILLFRDCQFS